MLQNLKARLRRLVHRPKPVDEAPLIAQLPRSAEEAVLAIPPADIRNRIVSQPLTSFQTSEHVRRSFSPHFEVVDHVANGMTNFQDLAICRKPTS